MNVFSRAAVAGSLSIAALLLGTAGPALAADPAATAAPLPDGNVCAPMMARWQGAEAEYSALKPPDLDAFNVAQNAIDRAAHLCEAGQADRAAAAMAASSRRPPDLKDFNARVSP